MKSIIPVFTDLKKNQSPEMWDKLHAVKQQGGIRDEFEPKEHIHTEESMCLNVFFPASFFKMYLHSETMTEKQIIPPSSKKLQNRHLKIKIHDWAGLQVQVSTSKGDTLTLFCG